MVFYEPDARDRELLPHDPFKALVAPRPIGWVSTVGPDGEVNLAPYSFFNAICDRPPMINNRWPKKRVSRRHCSSPVRYQIDCNTATSIESPIVTGTKKKW